MEERVYFVQLIDGDLLNCENHCFKDRSKAEKCFTDKLIELFKNDGYEYTDKDIRNCINEGWYADQHHSSVIFREIEVE